MERDRRLLVYALIDPRTERVRYIGKSMRGLHRPKTHTAPSVVKLNAETHRGRWIAQLLTLGLTPVVRVLQVCVTPDELSAAEVRWIAHGRTEGWPLTNLTAGGEGTPGRRVSEATREKMRAALKGHPALVAANAGKTLTPEHRAKIARAHLGLKQSPEHTEAHAAAIRGKPMHPKTRAALLKSITGRKLSVETRAKISAARRARRVV